MTMDFDSTKPPYKQPQRQAEPSEEQPKAVPELKEISTEELKDILKEHKKWLGLKGKEGKAASLGKTNLQQAKLRATNLPNVKNLTQAQLNQTCVDENTQPPEGLTRPKPCPEEELSKK